jgi:hypothetical protein
VLDDLRCSHNVRLVGTVSQCPGVQPFSLRNPLPHPSEAGRERVDITTPMTRRPSNRGTFPNTGAPEAPVHRRADGVQSQDRSPQREASQRRLARCQQPHRGLDPERLGLDDFADEVPIALRLLRLLSLPRPGSRRSSPADCFGSATPAGPEGGGKRWIRNLARRSR